MKVEISNKHDLGDIYESGRLYTASTGYIPNYTHYEMQIFGLGIRDAMDKKDRTWPEIFAMIKQFTKEYEAK